jgi:hypothetical protein
MSRKTQADRKTKVVLPIETLAAAVGMARVDGLARTAAFFRVDPKTVSRAHERLARVEPEERRASLFAIAKAKEEECLREWRGEALRFVRHGLRKLDALIEQSTPEQIRDVAGAVHLVLDKLVMKDLLPGAEKSVPRSTHADRPGPAGQDPKLAAAPSVGARAAGGAGPAGNPSGSDGGRPVH